jgi:predicted nucleotidyltransferase
MISDENKFGLTERSMQTVSEIFEKYPVVEVVVVFGSRAMGNYKLGSDLDLAIMNLGVDDKTMMKLKNDFEESSLPISVDIVNFADLKHADFIEHIERVGKVFYKKRKI